MSPRISRRNGRHNNCARHFRLMKSRGICSAIAIRSSATPSESKKDMKIEEVLSAPRSPWPRAYVERVIGSIRRECLDHVIVVDEESLRRTLRSYFVYYHRARLHLSLDRDSPDSRPVQSVGEIVAIP